MTYLRRGVAASLLLLTPALVACGDDDAKDADSKDASSSEATSTDDDRADDEAGETTDQEGGAGTETSDESVALSELNPEQQALYADVLLFVPVAEAESAESDGFGYATSSFKEPGEESATGMVRPEGMQVANSYTLQHNPDGFEFTLYSEDASMSWAEDVVRIDVPVDEVEHEALRSDADALQAAVQEWFDVDGEYPSVSSGFKTYELKTSFFSEKEERESEVPKGDDITMSFSAHPGSYVIALESDTTGEKAILDEDGVTYLAPRIVTED